MIAGLRKAACCGREGRVEGSNILDHPARLRWADKAGVVLAGEVHRDGTD